MFHKVAEAVGRGQLGGDMGNWSSEIEEDSSHKVNPRAADHRGVDKPVVAELAPWGDNRLVVPAFGLTVSGPPSSATLALVDLQTPVARFEPYPT